MADIKKPVATVKKDVTSAVAETKVATPAPATTAAPAEKKEEVKKEAKPAAKKPAAKKAAAKKPAAKKEAKPAAKPAAKKPAAKKATKKAATKKVAVKETAMFSLDEGQNFTADALMKKYLKSAKDRSKYDLGIKAAELKAVEIYVNVMDQTVYSVITKTDGTMVNDQFPM
jgi:hypothetical protein